MGVETQVTMKLKDRRYLIVIDDLWNIQAWNELKDVFPSSPDNCLGSRIIVTTRFCEVAPYRGRFKLLGPLKEQDSWELFSKKIFGKEKFPQELEPLGRRIVESCRGRPLVIVVVASILRASERTISRWSNIVQQFDRYWYHNEPLHIHILNVCYHEIPQHLKMCFLYLGIFPEDFEISVRQLTQLWISEGLVQYSNTESRVEDVAEAYLEELIGRNMIQVTKRRSDGGPKSCRIHDLLRDLCIRSSPWHENFLSVYTGGDDSFPVNPRRLSILGDWPVDMWNSTTNSDTSTSSNVLRSLSCFSQDNQSISKENWESFFKHFPFLRVLNLGEGEVGIIPEAIEELFHMRYLRVKPLKNTSIPQSIFNLWNLETIDLRTTQFHELPEGIWKMQQLRHIYVDGPSGLPQIENEDCLPNLQTLSCVSIDPEDDIHLSKKAPNLRKLGLYGYRCCSKREQEATFDLPHLQSLKFVEECTFEDLDEPIKLPTTITKITVKGANLLPDVIKMFEELPNLQILKLVNAYIDGGELVFGEGSFPKLKLLIFEDSNIATWRLEKGAMPNLHRLVINECRFLTELPAEPLKVSKLKKLELFWASPTLAKKLEADLKENKGLKLVIHSTISA